MSYIEKTVKENLRRELQAVKLYEAAANRESDARRRGILQRLADIERKHAQMWRDKLVELGVETALSGDVPGVEEIPQGKTLAEVLDDIERIEQGNDAWYQSQRNVIDDPSYTAIYDEIDADEHDHADISALLGDSVDVPAQAPKTESRNPERRLSRMLAAERWHRTGSGGWVGDAIYGVNDGLGAIFGIIAGVAGYTTNDNTILVSGVFGALASTFSMGAGAWLSTKSENELQDAELLAERREIEENPGHEIEELSLLYELKGFETQEAARIARQIAEDKDLFLRTMAQEELGIHETGRGNPWKSATFGGVSTLVGSVVPLIPFFFMHGVAALITAAVVSIVAHFIVGALKSRMTVRGWWASGWEMTLVGVIVGGASYLLGELGQVILR